MEMLLEFKGWSWSPTKLKHPKQSMTGIITGRQNNEGRINKQEDQQYKQGSMTYTSHGRKVTYNKQDGKRDGEEERDM